MHSEGDMAIDQYGLMDQRPDYFAGDEDPTRPLTYEEQMAKEQAWAAAHPDMGYTPSPGGVQGIVDQNAKRYNDPQTWSNSEGFQLGGTHGRQESMYNELANMWRGAQGRAATQADPMLGLAARGDQQQGLMYWQNAAAGNGPTAAQAMYQNNANAAMANQASMAASARGGGPAAIAAQRAAMMGGSTQLANAANQAAQLRAQEMQSAMQGYSTAAQGIRGQDAQWAMDQARLQEAQRARNDAMQLGAAQEYMGNRQADSRRGQANYTNEGNWARGYQANQQARDDDERRRNMGMIGSGLGMFRTAALVSDRNAKTGVRSGDRDVEETLSALAAKTYAYKDARHGRGKQIGIIAQDLERTPLGRSAIVPHPDGFRAIDVTKGLSISLAGLANLNKRLQKMEGRRG